MNALGYGAHLMVDGFGSAAPLMDEGWIIESAVKLLAALETPESRLTQVSYWFSDGVSVGLALPESHLTLHTLAARCTVCLNLFSPQMMSTEGIGAVFRERFEIGRLEGHLGSRTIALPQDHDRAVLQLLGERSYTEMRLDDSLLVV